MSEPRLISPMLDGFALGSSISEHSGVNCYPAMRSDSDEHYIVKTISIPASQVQLDALLLTGAYPDAESARSYFQELAQGIQSEVEILDKLAARRGFTPYEKIQIVPMEEGVGFDVYLLSRYNNTLERHLKRAPLTHLSAVNLGIDLCAAMAVCRDAGYLYVDLKPGNIFMPGHQEYRIGDIGFVRLDSLKYASLPDRYRSAYTPPEVADAYSTLNTTMDTYALGLVLYQIYNNGALPFDSAEAKQALMAALAAGEPLPAPAYADYEMAQIIEKACALQPGDRWADPVEMGQALVSYMQRNGANDVPIVPPVIPEPAEDGADDDASDVPPAEDPPGDDAADDAAVPGDDAADDTPAGDAPGDDAADAASDDTDSPDVPADDSAEDPAGEPDDSAGDETPADDDPDDWIDRMDAILAEDADETDDDSDDPQPTLRQLLERDDLDDAGELTADEISDDTAGILTQAQALIEHETPAPVVAPDPIDVPIPAPIVLEPEPGDTDESPDDDMPSAEDGDAADGDDDAPAAPADDSGSNDDTDSYADADAAGDAPSRHRLRRFLGILAGLLTAAALCFGAYYFYQNYYLQTIDAMTIDGRENQLTVTIDTDMDESLLTVVCKDTYGNPLYATPEGGTVIFTELLPGTQYIISLEVEGFHKLVGASPATYYTPAETRLIDLSAVTGQEDGSMILSFGVEGVESEEWTLHCTAEGEQERVVKFTGHTVTVTGLTVGTEYTLTITGSDETYLVEEYSLTHTASSLILAENLTVSGYTDGSITASWTAPEGVSVARWIARCYNEDGYDQVVEVTEPSAVFTDITENAAYTLEVTADGMTLGKRTFVTANPITITDVTAQAVGGTISLSWSYEGQAPAGGWLVLYTADGSTSQQVLNTDEPAAVLPNVAPGSHYDIIIQTPDATSIFGGSAAVDVPDGSAFEGYGLNTSRISVSTHAVPASSGWGSRELRDSDPVSTFAPGDSMALLYYTKSRYQIDYSEVSTLFVIRDAEGKLVSTSTNTRSWADMWYNGACVETVTGLPTVPGSYSLTIYLDGMKLTIQEFTIE